MGLHPLAEDGFDEAIAMVSNDRLRVGVHGLQKMVGDLGDLFFQANSAKSAIKSYEKSTSIDQNNEYAYLRMGEMYFYIQEKLNRILQHSVNVLFRQ